MSALTRSEAEFRASFEGAAVGKVFVDPTSQHIVRVNRAFASMLGYTPDELVGRSRTEFTVLKDQPEFASEYARLLSGEVDPLVHEKRYVCHDGRHIWGRVTVAIQTTSEVTDYRSERLKTLMRDGKWRLSVWLRVSNYDVWLRRNRPRLLSVVYCCARFITESKTTCR